MSRLVMFHSTDFKVGETHGFYIFTLMQQAIPTDIAPNQIKNGAGSDRIKRSPPVLAG